MKEVAFLLKEKVPFRLVFSAKNTVIEKVDKWVERHVTPLIKEDPSFLLDTTEWIQTVQYCNEQYGPFDSGETIRFIHDVVGLYPNTPYKKPCVQWRNSSKEEVKRSRQHPQLWHT